MSDNQNEEELNIDKLEEVVGGIGLESASIKCPACGSTNITSKRLPLSDDYNVYKYTCLDCSHKWSVKRRKSSDSNPRPQES